MPVRRLVLLGFLPLLLSACPAGDPDPVAVDAPAEDPEVVIIETAASDVGAILVSERGRALYVSDDDPPGESACYDECLERWQPLVATTGVAARAGADEELVGAIERDDGIEQVTYADRPLYFFEDDSEAGETQGQGLEGTWWVVGPDGEPIREDEP